MLRDVHTAHFFHPATLEATLWALNKISVIIIALAALGCWQFVEGGTHLWQVDLSDPSKGCLCLEFGGATQRWRAREGSFPRKETSTG